MFGIVPGQWSMLHQELLTQAPQPGEEESVRDLSNCWKNGGDILEKENLLAFLELFQAGECLFCILPLGKQEGLGHLYQVHQPSGVYYKHKAHGNQICPGEEDAPAD